jgi:flavin reductase (DIM6/NTAB) family NADH-FMN oxidoreductase RutF
MAPPSLLICVNQRSGSLQAIRGSGGFMVNLLREDRHALAELFASPSDDKFVALRWRLDGELGLPLLEDDAAAYVECALEADIPAGTHAILIGLVRSSGRTGHPGRPLVYYDRTYGRWVA